MSENLKICRHILLQSPPGQFDLILSDLQNILSDIPTDFIDSVRSEYNDKCCHVLATVPSNIDDKNELGNTSEPTSSLQSLLRTEIGEYIRNHYQNKGVEVSYDISRALPSSSSIAIKMYCERVHLENCHAGSWAASWILEKSDINRNIYLLRGKAKVHAHYFEDGNMQLLSEVDFDPVSVTSDKVISQIGKWEEEVMADLARLYENMNEGTLKSMRRVLPISRTKMEWSAQKHRMVRLLNEPK